MPLAKQLDNKFTYSDYVTWSDGERWEILDGRAYNMMPAPSVYHQDITGNIFSLLKQKLKSKSCRAFIAPTDVVLSEYDVVQPDVFVVCDKEKITEKNIQGAPDLIIEVLSPSSALEPVYDLFKFYESHLQTIFNQSSFTKSSK